MCCHDTTRSRGTSETNFPSNATTKVCPFSSPPSHATFHRSSTKLLTPPHFATSSMAGLHSPAIAKTKNKNNDSYCHRYPSQFPRLHFSHKKTCPFSQKPRLWKMTLFAEGSSSRLLRSSHSKPWCPPPATCKTPHVWKLWARWSTSARFHR